MTTIEGTSLGEWSRVVPQTAPLDLDPPELCERYGMTVHFLPCWPCLSSTAGEMFSHWLCSCSPLAGVAGAASFPLRLQFHWESSPAAGVLSSSSPGLKNASPLWPGLGCFSVSCFLNPVCSCGKSSFSSSVQSAL